MNAAIDNLLKALEAGIITESTQKRLQELETRKANLTVKIENEKHEYSCFATGREILAFFSDILKKSGKQLVQLLIKKIILYDDRTYRNKTVEVSEQIGRYCCFALMVFQIPYTYFGFWFPHALMVYLAVNGTLCLAYLIFWTICWTKNGKLKALSLSIIPSCIFLFSGIILGYIPLAVFAVVFGISHIYISCKNIPASNINSNERISIPGNQPPQ